MERKQPHVGDHVIYTNEVGVDRNAVVIAVWGDVAEQGSSPYGGMPGLNVVMASADPDCTDIYGRQIERETSVVHKTDQPAHGCYWRWPGEERNPIQEPTDK